MATWFNVMLEAVGSPVGIHFWVMILMQSQRQTYNGQTESYLYSIFMLGVFVLIAMFAFAAIQFFSF